MNKLVVLSCASAVVAACTGRTAVQVPVREPVSVATVAAAARPVPQTFERGGMVRAQAIATLSSRIVAPVVTTPANAGERVRAGAVLMTLDARELDAAARRADAGAAAAEQALTAAQADRAAASASASLAAAAHGRIAMLHERRSATSQELDAAVADLRSADAHVASADARIAEATAALTAAREGASEAHLSASYATIRAPFDGVVSERLVDAGSLASPGIPLVRVEDTRRFRLEVPVDESYAAAIATGAPVDVSFDDPALGTQHARVTEVARTVDAGSHTFLVKIDLAPNARLRSGLFARAQFASATRTVLTIPRAAVTAHGQLSTVYVVSAGRARMRVISLGPGDADVEVLAGLSAGERVVIAPPPALQDGDAVREQTTGTVR